MHWCGPVLRSGRFSEFVEGCRHTQTLVARFDTDFVVTSPQVLDESMAANHDRRGPIRSQAAHRPQPCLEPSVIALDPVVRILARVVQHLRKEVVDHAVQRGPWWPLLAGRVPPALSRRT